MWRRRRLPDRLAIAALLASTGCASLFGLDDPQPVAGDAAIGIDSSSDAPALTACMARWLDGTLAFGPATPVDGVNTTMYERDPTLSPDERTIYFSSVRGGSTNADVWIATRSTITQPFASVTQESALSSTANDFRVSMTDDQLTAVIASNRTGTAGGSDLWMSTRATLTSTWSVPATGYTSALNTNGNEFDPELSADGLHLYFAPDPAPQRIFLAIRMGPASSFQPPSLVSELTSGSGEADPTVSADERLIVFTSRRPGGPGLGDLWYATRASRTDPWGSPKLVPDVNSVFDDGDAWLSPDGCRLYFSSTRNANQWDIFTATVVPH